MCRTHAKQLYCFLRALSSNDENTHFLDLPSDKHFGWKSRYSSSSHFLDAVGADRDFDDIELDNLLYNGFTSNSLDPTWPMKLVSIATLLAEFEVKCFFEYQSSSIRRLSFYKNYELLHDCC